VRQPASMMASMPRIERPKKLFDTGLSLCPLVLIMRHHYLHGLSYAVSRGVRRFVGQGVRSPIARSRPFGTNRYRPVVRTDGRADDVRTRGAAVIAGNYLKDHRGRDVDRVNE